MTRLPRMGLSKPPARPGGGVISVKTPGLRPTTPFEISVHSTSANIRSPNAAAATDKDVTTMLVSRLRRYNGVLIRRVSAPCAPA